MLVLPLHNPRPNGQCLLLLCVFWRNVNGARSLFSGCTCWIDTIFVVLDFFFFECNSVSE